jgi:hypothetical protein
LVNLLANALKFTPRGGAVLAFCYDAGAAAGQGVLRFSVHDSGPGIDPQLRPRLFEPFTQGDASASRRHGGTGLGLAISRRLAEALGGELGELPTSRGALFWCSIPCEVETDDWLPTPAVWQMGAADHVAVPAVQPRFYLVTDNPLAVHHYPAVLRAWGWLLADDPAHANCILIDDAGEMSTPGWAARVSALLEAHPQPRVVVLRHALAWAGVLPSVYCSHRVRVVDKPVLPWELVEAFEAG